MRAVISERYGSPDVLELGELPKPEPADDEVLIRVHASTVSRTDCGMRRAHPFFMRLATGVLRPRLTVLGVDFAGIVESTGAAVTAFKPGDRVFGLSHQTYGAHADYLCLPETGAIATMPAGADFADCVVCEGAWYADCNLNAFDLQPGQKLLIYGASGAIGTAALQLAKHRGIEVTAVVATRHVELAEALGADRVIDYTAQDFTRIGERFDVILDAVGKTTLHQCRDLLEPDGLFAATDLGPWWQNLLLPLWFSITGRKRVIIPFPEHARASVERVKSCIEAGAFKAVIDRHYPLEQIADAYRYVETEQKTGIVVIDVSAGRTKS